MIKKFTILLTTVILSGCVAVPKKDATGGISEKSLYFPKENQKTYVVSGGIAHLKTAYKSGYRFKLKAPITKSVQMGLATVSIGSDEYLQPSILDDREHHCATGNAYRDLIGFGSKRVCFLEEDGKFTALRYAPGAYWFKVDLNPPLETTKTEIVTEILNSYAKKELVYNGSTEKTLMFIEKEYSKDLEKPSKIKPVNVKIEGNSTNIEISGAKINVLEYTSNSMTYFIEKSFD